VWRFAWKRDWPKVAAGAFLADVIIYTILAAHHAGAKWSEIFGVALQFLLQAGVLTLVGFVVYLTTREKLWLPLRACVLVAIGGCHFFAGVNDWNEAAHRENGTIMQQQLAELEIVGGAVVAGLGLMVYTGRQILKAVTKAK